MEETDVRVENWSTRIIEITVAISELPMWNKAVENMVLSRCLFEVVMRLVHIGTIFTGSESLNSLIRSFAISGLVLSVVMMEEGAIILADTKESKRRIEDSESTFMDMH